MASPAQQKSHLELESPWASYVEADFPWFSHTLDARHLGGDWPKDNLTPRGLILKLGHGHYACFDTDLLRIALVWKENEDGEYLTMDGMAPGSYRLPNRKASAGQKSLPRPIGTPVLANGLYPGWSVGRKIDRSDPRTRSIDKDEPGLGPLPESVGEWIGLKHFETGVVLRYRIGDATIEEAVSVATVDPIGQESGVIARWLRISKHRNPITLSFSSTRSHTFEPSDKPRIFQAIMTWGISETEGHLIVSEYEKDLPSTPFAGIEALKWPNEIVTGAKPPVSRPHSPYQFEEVELPLKNPWKRNVRLSAFDFFSDGRAAISTFDGDVWIVENLAGDFQEVTWKRFASGLHDPIGLEISGDEIYVFDRNGIVRLRDENGDGEADFYENFCNLVAQTAETREFANDIREKPGGGFYLAKGGQVSTTRGRFNGTVVEVSQDGKSIDVIATGFRMPYIGVNPKTGLVTASDQQGHWKPATPIHVVRQGGYYGFQPAYFKDKAVHPRTIDQPEIWIPHFVNQSGASQVWTFGAKLGPLNDSLVHVGYNRPEIFKVYLDDSGKSPQGAVVPVMDGFPSGLLKGRIHPRDGSLWLTGFKIWGTSADQISGLYRVTWTGGKSWIPEDVRSSDRGILLRFHQPVDPGIAASLASYTVDRWNYKQTHNYGSGNFKLDGSPGQETLPVASVQLSKDKRSVFLGVPDMKPVHSVRVTYRLPAKTEQPVIRNAYLTVHGLSPIDLEAEGFESNEVDLVLKAGAGQEMKEPEPTVEIGEATATKYGCIACHTTDGSKVPAAIAAAAGAGQQVVVGPGWKGLWGSNREFTDGTVLKKVDEVYLRESIVDPGRKVQKGFETEKTGVGMPSYLGVLKDYEIDSIILYIKSLGKKK